MCECFVTSCYVYLENSLHLRFERRNEGIIIVPDILILHQAVTSLVYHCFTPICQNDVYVTPIDVIVKYCRIDS